MIPTSVNGQASTQTAATATIGIASLILEGRALSDDDFVATTTTTASPRLDFQSPKFADDQKFSTYLSSRRSNTSNAIPDINFAYMSIPSETNTSDPTLQHMQRLRQKLGQLRQSSPSTSSGEHISADQAIAIGLNSRWNTMTTPNEDEDENALVQYLQRKQTTNRFVHPITATLQSLATTCLRTTSPRSNKVMTEPSETFFGNSRIASGAGGCSSFRASTSSFGLENAIPKTIKTPPTRSADKVGTPKQGPHCDQFLRKVGLTKADASVDLEEHICDMTNLNEICYRWQIHCRQIDFIMSTMDPICIEVYLGPENHEILLEQWIIEQKERSTTPTMTIQSLSNAIRSQLYFSQITAWTDLIKNAKPNDRDIIEHGRIKLVEKLVNGTNTRAPRLDIFYRIRAYDATACFNSKPNVHDFPNVVISENCSISVCLKSLPRIQNGIPRINFVENENTNNPNNASCNSSSSSSCSSNVNNNSYNSSNHINHAASTAICSESSQGSSIEQSSSSAEECMVLDDRLSVPCQEKGKHRCSFDDEEYASSDAVIEGMSSAELSHREKQLLKYRKRMMKRDKKSKMTTAANGVNNSKAAHEVSANSFSKQCPKMVERSQQEPNQNQNESSKQRHDDDNLTKAASYQMLNHHQPSVAEFGSINSYRPPLYRTQQISVAEAVQTNSVEMVSTGTQTPSFPLIFPCCDNCGNEMELICTKCDNSKGLDQQPPSMYKNGKQVSEQSKINFGSAVRGAILPMEGKAESTAHGKNEDNSPPPKLGKGDLLLQAIERASRHRFFSDTRNNNNNHSSTNSTAPPKTKANDCQLCKRQKTQHIYRSMMETENDNIGSSANNLENEYFHSKLDVIPACESNETVDHHMSKDCACSDEYAENCCTKSNVIGSHPVAQKVGRASVSPNIFKLSEDIDAQFKTPKAAGAAPVKLSPKNQQKPSPLFINCSEKFPLVKSIPKINLTNIFGGSPSTGCTSAPIPILSTDSSAVSAAFSFDNINKSPDIPVQKSNSAPTLPNSPSLSPRFQKQAAIYKRRSRHLSDRSSERSSIGSDEQFSDEDLESLYSPTSSPIKTRLFLKSSGFGKRPLLGCLEESLLQKRLVPKSQVAGFKVLLGASGGFCPTQLTIPAIASFYELSNESTLSTPYVCEIRLSRKGYTVPRVGTIQATLLNPLGTVVRMFVVPYDFRDMPAMSQTFIRQRVLAVDDNNGEANTSKGKDAVDTTGLPLKQLTPGILSCGNLSGLKHNDVSFGEQMRTLRYAIHLRFQTSRSGRLALHTDIRLLISRRTDCDTAAAHAKGALESPNELRIVTIKPENPKYSSRQENPNKI